MELPSVLTKIGHQTPQILESFWALEIWDGGVKSAIWQIEEKKVRVVSIGTHEESSDELENLLGAVDKSFAASFEGFPQQESEPQKVIFGLTSAWTSEEKILPEKQKLLQGICDRLELSPLGFVLTVDALNHRLRETEGVPPSAILVSPQKDVVQVAVLIQGKVEKEEFVVRSDNLADDVFEGLVRYAGESLPSRILLYDGADMEETRQALLDFPWQEKLPFLHLPKIEILPADFDITAVCLAGGSEAAKSLGFEVEIEEGKRKEGQEVHDDHGEKADFGFVAGKDIQEVEAREEVEKVGKVEEVEEVGEVEKAEKVAEPVRPPLLLIKAIREKLSGFSLPALTLPSFSWWPILLLAGILFLAGGFLFFSWYVARAEVILTVAPKTTEKEFGLAIDPNQEVVDEGNQILPGRVMETEVSGEDEKETTGKKTVGEKANGEITIFNTGPARILATGITLTGPGGLKFTFNKEVSIASGSAVSRTETKTTMTAADIGADYNLAADSQLAVGNLDRSLIGAKNSLALTGGTSRQIQAVSEDDLKSLLSSLSSDLTAKAKNDLLASIPTDRKLVEQSITTKEAARNFSRKAGEEASSVKLVLRMRASALTFGQKDFFALVKKQLESSLPSGYSLKEEGLGTQFEVEKQEKDGLVRLKVKVSARFLPQISLEEVAREIKGASLSSAEEKLSGLTGVVSSQVKLSPSLPLPFKFLPKREEKIQFELRGE